VISELLGVAPQAVKIILGDTDVVKAGGGSHYGRSKRQAGAGFRKSLHALVEKGKKVAAAILVMSADQIEFKDGRLARGTNP
jgi:carbon-monoxide dehydrogenase large subunit